MKKLIIAALALASFSVASFSQTTAAATKATTPKSHAVKKAADQQSTKALAYNKATKPSPATAASQPKEGVKKATTTKKDAATAIKKHKARKGSMVHAKKGGKHSQNKENKKQS